MKRSQKNRIITVTLNPAIDKTIEVNDFKLGEVNRISTSRLDAGGKGINVSKVIRSLGGGSTALGILSGRNGEFIKAYLDSLNIENNFIFAEGETRTNLKIIDKLNHSNTDINEKGNAVNTEDLERVKESIFRAINEDSILVLSGSIPEGTPKDIYGLWIEEFKKLGVKTILDADGEVLKEGIKAVPYLIKPNIHELEKLYGESFHSIEEIIKAANKLLKYGIEKVVISLGKDGGLFMDNNNIIHAKGMQVPVNSTVGAGDSMVAAIALSIEKGISMEETVILAAAASTANVMTSGSEPAQFQSVLELAEKVKFERIKF